MDESQERKPVSQTIGSLASKVVNMRSLSGSTQTLRVQPAETAQSPKDGSTQTSTLPSALGATTLSNSLPEMLAKGNADKFDETLLRWRASLPRSSRQAIADERGITRIQLERPIYPVEETDRLKTLLETALSPSTTSQIGPELTACLSVTKSRERDGIDLKMMVARFMDELLVYPADIVQTALRNWARDETFWPALAEIRKACQWRLERRRRIYEGMIR